MERSNLHIEFVDFLGDIRNNTLVNGKGVIFRISDLDNNESFEAILFVHDTVRPFITLGNKEYNDRMDFILEQILIKYNIKELLNLKK